MRLSWWNPETEKMEMTDEPVVSCNTCIHSTTLCSDNDKRMSKCLNVVDGVLPKLSYKRRYPEYAYRLWELDETLYPELADKREYIVPSITDLLEKPQ